MTKLPSHPLPNLQACVHCGYIMERGTPLTHKDCPTRPGVISICACCGYIGKFDERLNIVELEPEDRRRISKDENAKRVIRKIHRAILERMMIA